MISGGMGCTRNSNDVTTPKFAPAPAKRPHQFGIGVFGDVDEFAARRDEVGADQVVAGETELGREPPVAAAEAEAADASGGDASARRRQAEHLGLAVVLTPERPGVGARSASFGIDVNPFEARQVDEHSALDRAHPGHAVPAAADCQGQLALTGEGDRIADVGCSRGPHDERRPAIDHPVVDRAGLVVPGVGGLDRFAGEPGGETDLCRGHGNAHRGSSHGAHSACKSKSRGATTAIVRSDQTHDRKPPCHLPGSAHVGDSAVDVDR